MENNFKDFSVEDKSLVENCKELEMVICNRQEKCATTVEYKEVYDRLNGFIDKLKNLLPNDKKTIMGLKTTITELESTCYSAAYRDGMSDLMTAITFNKIGITMTEYCGSSN